MVRDSSQDWRKQKALISSEIFDEGSTSKVITSLPHRTWSRIGAVIGEVDAEQALSERSSRTATWKGISIRTLNQNG